MPTTLSDHGRTSEKYGNIPHYYAFPLRLFFKQHQIRPKDVLTWCEQHANGYYKIVSYTHKRSVRNAQDPRQLDKRVVYVDRIYLSSKDDALIIKLSFDVISEKVLNRPKLARLPRKKRVP